MTALAAMRGGAGYVTVGGPASLELSFTVRLLEAMMIGLPEEDGALSAEAAEPALAAIDRADAVVLGPGLSKKPGARAFAREMFERIDVPLVIDADGLNALQGVFPRTSRSARADRAHAARRRAGAPARGGLGGGRARAGGARAGGGREGEGVRRAQGRRHARRLPGRARGGLARRRAGARHGGTGDVLSGVIGAMLAKGLAAAHAACAGVYAHVRAGQIAAAPHGPDGVIASDVIYALPAALSA